MSKILEIYLKLMRILSCLFLSNINPKTLKIDCRLNLRQNVSLRYFSLKQEWVGDCEWPYKCLDYWWLMCLVDFFNSTYHQQMFCPAVCSFRANTSLISLINTKRKTNKIRLKDTDHETPEKLNTSTSFLLTLSRFFSPIADINFENSPKLQF
jgi:hypothetical protein